MQQAPKDPDSALVALFKHQAQLNEAKTREAGRKIFDDVEVVEIRRPGAKDYGVYPATAMSHWQEDPFTGTQTPVTYAERFAHQYRQFKMHAAQTKSGTPLDEAPFLSEGRRAELRAQNIYTVEALASIDGAELKNLGPGGREMKNLAIEFINEGLKAAPNLKMQAELEALRARNTILEEDAKLLKQVADSRKGDDEFDAMSLEQLREFITTNTGKAPMGSSNRKTLVRMAMECRPDKAA